MSSFSVTTPQYGEGVNQSPAKSETISQPLAPTHPLQPFRSLEKAEMRTPATLCQPYGLEKAGACFFDSAKVDANAPKRGNRLAGDLPG